ncbi:MAG: peptidoglycan bridge formation protein FemAB [Treponematales bacterium]
MRVRLILPEERFLYDAVVDHPVQSWQWGEFREAAGQKVERIGFFEGDRLVKAVQSTFHRLPGIGGTVGYAPKAFAPDATQIEALGESARRNGALFIKLEPNVYAPVEKTGAEAEPLYEKADFRELDGLLRAGGARPGKPMFTRYNFHLDLRPGEEELFQGFHSKTRYNIRLAQKKGVEVVEESSEEGMETFISLMRETTKRQVFYAHGPDYYRTMLRVIGAGPGRMLHIFHARYQGAALAAWVIFHFNNKLYYPYGASGNQHRELMASNLMMWSVIRFGKSLGCVDFDLWGALGPKADPNDAFYGFHRFKQGYNPTLMENLGTYDLVYRPLLYRAFNGLNALRWGALRLKKRLQRG